MKFVYPCKQINRFKVKIANKSQQQKFPNTKYSLSLHKPINRYDVNAFNISDHIF